MIFRVCLDTSLPKGLTYSRGQLEPVQHHRMKDIE